MTENYMLGALRDEPSVKDWVATVKPVALPEEAIKPCAYPHDNQQAGDCVMQAIRTAFREYADSKPFGVAFGYGYYRDHTEAGLYPRKAYDDVRKYGLPMLTVDPKEYEVPEAINYARLNADELLPYCGEYAGWTYYALNTVDAVKAAIVDSLKTPGMRVTATLRVETFKVAKNGFWPCCNSTIGLHRVMLLGYGKHQGVEGVLIRNSWGDDWGLNGDAWVTWGDLMGGDDVKLHVPPKRTVEPEHIDVSRRTLRLKDPYMRDGDGYTDVTEAQTKLGKHGYSVGEIDGIFGGATDTAVKAFQTAKSLTSDGIIGPKTWLALDAAPDPTPAPEPTDGAKGLVAYCREHIGDVYCWRGYGQNATENAIDARETSEANANRAKAFLAAQTKAGVTDMLIYDCSGLISAYLIAGNVIAKKYDCDMLMAKCRQIARDDLIFGDLVFRHKITNGKADYYHVGVYVGKGRVIEAKGRDDGVVCRGIDASGSVYWTAYGRLTLI